MRPFIFFGFTLFSISPISILRFCGFAVLLLNLSSCATSRLAERRFAKKIQKEVEKSPVFNRAFTGFTLLDPATGKTLADVHGDKYFTPASNTKILTLATCLEVLGDSVPGVQYVGLGPSRIFRGTGDPTFLNSNFNAWQPVFRLLKNDSTHGLIHSQRPMPDAQIGRGWSWDDLNESYSPERTDWPIYGGLFTMINAERVENRQVQPQFFEKMVVTDSMILGNPTAKIYAAAGSIYLWPNCLKNDSILQPIHFVGLMMPTLLADTTRQWWSPVPVAESAKIRGWRTLYSTPLDTVLRRMMHQSDNFIAEQMLLVCAGQKFDILQQDTMIKWMLDSVLTSLPQRLRWVDGSGLSRYNLISPRDLAQVLLKLWKEQPHKFLLSLFPAGGMNGTVSDWYKGKNGEPYVFAKTGSMSGVHCLSGYVVTKRGKTLVFSFMHNNFIGSNRAWKEEMQRILERIASSD